MKPFANKPTIIGNRVTLRPIDEADAAHLWHDIQDDDARRLTGTHEEFERTQIEQWCASRSEQTDRIDLAVVEHATDAWAGEVVVSDWDADNGSCSFRIALSAHAQDRGLGSEATQLIIDYVFDQPAVNRLELEVYAFNLRAVAVYQRLGFEREGVRRQALRWDGEWIDAIVMSIIRSDRT